MAKLVTWGQEDGQTTNLSTIDAFLKEDYVLQQIQDQVNMSTFLLSKMTAERTTAGRRFRFPLRLGVSEGQGNRKERVALPEEGFGSYDEAYGNVVFQYGTLDISGPAIAATETGQATFTQALKQSIKDCRDGFTLEAYRQAWGDGTGTMALVNGTGNSKIIPVTSPYGLDYDEANLTPDQKVRVFRKGMKILLKTSGTVRTITGVDPQNGTIHVDTATARADGEKIIRGDSTVLSNENNEYHGISSVMKTTGTYLGIDRALEPGWQPNIIDLDGEALTEDALQAAFDMAEISGDGKSRPSMLLSEHMPRRIYINLLASYKRFVSPGILKGGFSVLDYNGVPWAVDKLAPPQRVYYLNQTDWVWMVMKGIGWADEDGHILKWAGTDAYKAILRAYRDMVCKNPANQTMLMGVVPVSESV